MTEEHEEVEEGQPHDAKIGSKVKLEIDELKYPNAVVAVIKDMLKSTLDYVQVNERVVTTPITITVEVTCRERPKSE